MQLSFRLPLQANGIPIASHSIFFNYKLYAAVVYLAMEREHDNAHDEWLYCSRQKQAQTFDNNY